MIGLGDILAVEEAVKEQDNGVMMVVETYLESLKIREEKWKGCLRNS
jgi:hypothetical protein